MMVVTHNVAQAAKRIPASLVCEYASSLRSSSKPGQAKAVAW